MNKFKKFKNFKFGGTPAILTTRYGCGPTEFENFPKNKIKINSFLKFFLKNFFFGGPPPIAWVPRLWLGARQT
jgi:hypothetical protein